MVAYRVTVTDIINITVANCAIINPEIISDHKKKIMIVLKLVGTVPYSIIINSVHMFKLADAIYFYNYSGFTVIKKVYLQ